MQQLALFFIFLILVNTKITFSSVFYVLYYKRYHPDLNTYYQYLAKYHFGDDDGPGPKRQHTWTSKFVVNSGECPVRRIGFKNCSPTANSTDIFYISFVYYLFMCRSACWRPRISLAQKAEQQRITNTKACWYPCW